MSNGFTKKGKLLFSLTEFCISQQKSGKCEYQGSKCKNCPVPLTYGKIKFSDYGEEKEEESKG